MSTTNSQKRFCEGSSLALQWVGNLRDGDGPAFKEPWEARAFAMALALHEKGLFDWSTWVQTFSGKLKELEAESGAEAVGDYYVCWMKALEELVTRRDVCSPQMLQQRLEDWRWSAQHTPHGAAIELRTRAR